MRKFIILLLSIAILSACSGKDLNKGDSKACEIYETTVELAGDNKITDDEMLDKLEEAWYVAESDRLQDLLDDLLIYFEEGDGDLQKIVNSIKVYCSLD